MVLGLMDRNGVGIGCLKRDGGADAVIPFIHIGIAQFLGRLGDADGMHKIDAANVQEVLDLTTHTEALTDHPGIIPDSAGISEGTQGCRSKRNEPQNLRP